MRSLLLALLCVPALSGAEPIELIGKARVFKSRRDYLTYYWGDDFHFFLEGADGVIVLRLEFDLHEHADFEP